MFYVVHRCCYSSRFKKRMEISRLGLGSMNVNEDMVSVCLRYSDYRFALDTLTSDF